MTFYTRVFGWRFEAWGPPGFYRVFTGSEDDPGVTEGALSERHQPLTEGGMNAFRCTISVSSIDETKEAIEDNGGKLRSQPFEIPGVGTVFEFADTEGNVVCAMKYADGDPRAC